MAPRRKSKMEHLSSSSSSSSSCSPSESTAMICLDDRFGSFEEFRRRLESYQQTRFVQFWLRDSRTIKSAERRSRRKTASVQPALVYYELKYCCIHGGQELRKRGKGIRKSSTFKQGCGAFISLRASLDGRHLVVRAMSESHNHEVSPEQFRSLPQQRRLPEEYKEKAKHLMGTQLTNKQVQQIMQKELGKVVLVKDLHNARMALNQRSKKNINAVAIALRKRYDATVHLLHDGGQYRCTYFQDQRMRRHFDAFPELVRIECVLKRESLQCILCMVEDGSGRTEPVAIAIMHFDNAIDSIDWFLKEFKSLNGSAAKTTAVAFSPYLVAHKIVHNHFPNAQLVFNETYIQDALGASGVCPDLIRDICHANSETAYLAAWNAFQLRGSSETLRKCEEWRKINNQWRCGVVFRASSETWSTLEELQKRLDSIPSHSTAEDVSEQVVHILAKYRAERDSEELPVANDDQYADALTPFAYRLVREEIDASEMPMAGNTTQCECEFHKNLRLPCRHMFAARYLHGLNPYSEDTYDVRWTRSYYIAARDGTLPVTPSQTLQMELQVTSKVALTGDDANTEQLLGSIRQVWQEDLEVIVQVNSDVNHPGPSRVTADVVADDDNVDMSECILGAVGEPVIVVANNTEVG